LAGTWGLARLVLRRDRIVLPIWIVLLVGIPVSYVQSFNDLFPTAESRRQYASNAGFVTLYGELNGTSLGEFLTWRLGFVPVMVGLISLLTVIRHTRVEEETGRAELLGSSVVGRHAALAAALGITFLANLLLAVLLALGMNSQDLPLAGSVALGLEFACAGWLFGGVGAIAAQLTASASTARGIGLSVLGAAYVLRAAGDTSAHSDGPTGVAFSAVADRLGATDPPVRRQPLVAGRRGARDHRRTRCRRRPAAVPAGRRRRVVAGPAGSGRGWTWPGFAAGVGLAVAPGGARRVDRWIRHSRLAVRRCGRRGR
jgi:hypothetical protein